MGRAKSGGKLTLEFNNEMKGTLILDPQSLKPDPLYLVTDIATPGEQLILVIFRGRRFQVKPLEFNSNGAAPQLVGKVPEPALHSQHMQIAAPAEDTFALGLPLNPQRRRPPPLKPPPPPLEKPPPR
jgi:hypothetical protein